MKIIDELLQGTFLIAPQTFSDVRGDFVKTYHRNTWAEAGLDFAMAEEFYSTSNAGVLRGMHFQVPPHAHKKVVFCLAGSVLDVMVDLREGPTYGQVASTELSFTNRHQLYLPEGIAHGFLSLEDESLLMYKTDTVHAPESDRGICWDSFGFDWKISHPVLSKRDGEHPSFDVFVTPFKSQK